MHIRRSPFFYVGDKYKIISKIKQYFPKKINRFIEPFTGGGTVFLNVDARRYLLNDIDKNIFALQNYLLHRATNTKKVFDEIYIMLKKYGLSRSYFEDIVPNKLKKTWKKTYYARFNKNGYAELRKDFNKARKKNLLELYVLLIYGFNRMLRFNSKGKFNLPVGNVDFNKNVYNSLTDYFKFAINKNIKWHSLDFAVFIKSVKYKNDDFVYLDPPYLISFSEYNKLWSTNKEYLLTKSLDELNKKGVKWAISNVASYRGRENRIFTTWMRNYNVFKIDSNYISYHNNSKKEIKEVLVTNYDKEK